MNQKVIDFLNTERVSSLAVVMPDGSSHSAAMHYSFDSVKSSVYFLTEKTSQKCQAVANGKATASSVVVGFDEKDNKVTVQLDGQLRWVTDALELEVFKRVYFTKFPDSQKYDSPESAYLEFKIIKWKYSDYRSHPEQVLTG